MLLLNMEQLFSIQWFSESTLSSFDWVNPIFLYCLPFVPLLFILRYFIRYRGQQKLRIALFESKLTSHWITYLRFIPPLLIQITIAFLLVALARPQTTNERVERWSEGIDITLVLDISESMQIQDFKPNRLTASKKVATNFIKGRLQDRIGIVVFSGEAISYAPLTTDYSFLKELIKDINFKMINAGGTAIGSAIAIGINRMEDSEAKSKIMILLSDGENTAGSIDPMTAADLAFAYGIKIYTIGIGQEGKVPWGKDMFGRTQYVEQHLDESVLRKISEVTGGQFFRATNNRALSKVFKAIDQLEKVEIKENRYKNTKDYYHIYESWGIFFLLAWLFCKSTFITNLLED